MNNYANLNVLTYNMGGSQVDYHWLCQHNNIPTTEQGYQASQKKTAAFFKDLASRGQADVIMLQEVYRKQRPLVEALRSEGYQVLNTTRQINDCAILLNQSRFQDVLNCSTVIEGNDTPIVIATDKETDQRVMFATAHVPGFSLDKERFEPQDSEVGDRYIQGVINTINELSQRHNVQVQIFGADMNANPEKLNQNRSLKEQWDHRFQKLESAGFQTHRSGETTEVFPKGSYRERELDFIFSRAPKENPLFQAGPTTALLNFGLDVDKLPSMASDHRPIKTEFTLQKAAHSITDVAEIQQAKHF